MRCLACDKRLNNRESTRRYSSSGGFIDLCDRCFSTVAEDIPDVEEGEVGEDVEIDLDQDATGMDWDYQQFGAADNE